MMCVSSKVLWYFVLLLPASTLETQENSTNGDKQSDNSTVRYDYPVNSMKHQNDEIKSTQCNSSENFIKSDNEMQYEPRIDSTKNEKKNNLERYDDFRGRIIKNCEESNQTSIVNSTEINDSTVQEIKNLFKIESEINSTSHKDENSKKNIKTIFSVSYEKCHNVTCVQLCCPIRNYLSLTGKCVAMNDSFYLPKLNKCKDGSDDPLFYLTVHDPCISRGFERRLLPFNEYLFLTDGSLYQGPNKFILPSDFCLASFNRDIYEVIVCTNQTKYPIYVSACLLVSLPFLLLTFVVYSILPELQNIHGYTIRAYAGSLFITYTIMYCGQQVSELQVDEKTCIILAYILNFSFLSSFFWLNVICFDIWWTFRKLRPCRTNIKQRKKKFVRYSIYAWGVPLIFIVIYFIMDHVDKIPENWIWPEICGKKFWFNNVEAKPKYFYVFIVAIVISNSYLFIHTTVSIMYQNMQIAHQLKMSDSEYYNRNKLRFKTFLRLFMMMGYGGIIWVIKIIAWINDYNLLPSFIWYPIDMINSLQGFIIFIIFVCNKKIKRLLLKRFGGQKCGPFCMIPTYNKSTTLNIISPHQHRQRCPRKKNQLV